METTVGELKRKLRLPSSAVVILKSGTQYLRNKESSLAMYGVSCGDTMHLVAGGQGGMQDGESGGGNAQDFTLADSIFAKIDTDGSGEITDN